MDPWFHPMSDQHQVRYSCCCWMFWYIVQTAAGMLRLVTMKGMSVYQHLHLRKRSKQQDCWREPSLPVLTKESYNLLQEEQLSECHWLVLRLHNIYTYISQWYSCMSPELTKKPQLLAHGLWKCDILNAENPKHCQWWRSICTYSKRGHHPQWWREAIFVEPHNWLRLGWLRYWR